MQNKEAGLFEFGCEEHGFCEVWLGIRIRRSRSGSVKLVRSKVSGWLAGFADSVLLLGTPLRPPSLISSPSMLFFLFKDTLLSLKRDRKP